MNEFHIPPKGTDYREYLNDGDVCSLHHTSRYEWARRVLRDLRPHRVLDIACGAGYGSEIIAKELSISSVTGCDYDEAGQQYARNHYSADNLRFVNGNIVTWQSANGSSLGTFDAIISFDTIEHLDHREIAMLSMERNLHDEGVLLLSTPSSHTQNVLNPSWDHHKIEYCYRDLTDLMERFFYEVISPLDSGFPHQNFWEHEINAGVSRYPNLGNPLFCRRPIRAVQKVSPRSL